MASENSKDRQLLDLFVDHFINRLKQPGEGIPAAELEVCRKLLQDNAVTIASIRKGDFGEAAKKASEDFPFDDSGRKVIAMPMMGAAHQ